jgi:tetratricopeptide (TPR) repeat protein
MAEKTLAQIPAAQRELYDKGIAALQKNNLDYAVTLFTGVLRKEPAFYDCREALRATQHKRSGGRGAGLFKKFMGSANTLTKGQLALRNDPYEALALAEEILNDDPSSIAAHQLLAEAALAVALPKTALLSLEVAFKARPKDRKLAEQLADAQASLGNRLRAEKILRDLLKEDPNNPALNQKLKNILATRTLSEGGYDKLADGSGSYRDILRDAEGARSIEQENRLVKDADVASRLIVETEARLAEEPTNQRLLRSLADLHLKRNEHEPAITYLQRIIEVTGIQDPGVLEAIRDAQLGRLTALESGVDPAAPDRDAQLESLRKQRAEFLLSDARRRADANPTDLQIRFELGRLLFEAGRLSEAIAELQKAQNNPNRRIPAMGLLARCFAARNMNDLAARKIEEALKEKPVFDDEAKDLRYTLGTVLEKMGRPAEAIEQFKIIYEQDIGYRDVMARVDAYYAQA